MKFKKIILSLGTTVAVIAPISSVVSCGSDNKDSFVTKADMAILNKHEFTHKADKFDLSSVSPNLIKDATIQYWIDGDTPVVTLDGVEDVHIRVTSIDTPELHVEGSDGKINVETKGNEYTWAMKAKAFGEKVMPSGSKVKVFTNGDKSYDRVVGSFFYKEKSTDSKYTSYAVEMLRNGLATSFVTDIASARSHSNVLRLNGLALADAYNFALKTGAGLFGAGIYKILGVHGVTSDASLRWTGKKFNPLKFGSQQNIYDVLHAI